MISEKVFRTINGRVLRRLCKSSIVSDRHGTHVYVDIETDLALFMVGGSIHAVSNICPHKREPAIHEGTVHNGTVTCPMHGWCFEIATGKNTSVGGGLRTYEVVEADGWVWLVVEEE